MNIIIEREIALHQYEIRTDKNRVVELLHPDFKEVGESGNSYNLKSILDLLGNEKPNGSQIHSQDFESSSLAPDIYLLLYKSATIDKTGKSSHFAKRSSIWVQNKNDWQMKYHQGTACNPFVICRS